MSMRRHRGKHTQQNADLHGRAGLSSSSQPKQHALASLNRVPAVSISRLQPKSMVRRRSSAADTDLVPPAMTVRQLWQDMAQRQQEADRVAAEQAKQIQKVAAAGAALAVPTETRPGGDTNPTAQTMGAGSAEAPVLHRFMERSMPVVAVLVEAPVQTGSGAAQLEAPRSLGAAFAAARRNLALRASHASGAQAGVLAAREGVGPSKGRASGGNPVDETGAHARSLWSALAYNFSAPARTAAEGRAVAFEQGLAIAAQDAAQDAARAIRRDMQELHKLLSGDTSDPVAMEEALGKDWGYVRLDVMNATLAEARAVKRYLLEQYAAMSDVFRTYAGASDDGDLNSMQLDEWMHCCRAMGLLAVVSKESAEAIFIRANAGRDEQAAALDAQSMTRFEFMEALLLAAKVTYGTWRHSDGRRFSPAEMCAQLFKRHVQPLAARLGVGEVRSSLQSEVLQSFLLYLQPKLLRVYTFYAAIDDEEALAEVDQGRVPRHRSLMNLKELAVCLEHAGFMIAPNHGQRKVKAKEFVPRVADHRLLRLTKPGVALPAVRKAFAAVQRDDDGAASAGLVDAVEDSQQHLVFGEFLECVARLATERWATAEGGTVSVRTRIKWGMLIVAALAQHLGRPRIAAPLDAEVSAMQAHAEAQVAEQRRIMNAGELADTSFDATEADAAVPGPLAVRPAVFVSRAAALERGIGRPTATARAGIRATAMAAEGSLSAGGAGPGRPSTAAERKRVAQRRARLAADANPANAPRGVRARSRSPSSPGLLSRRPTTTDTASTTFLTAGDELGSEFQPALARLGSSALRRPKEGVRANASLLAPPAELAEVQTRLINSRSRLASAGSQVLGSSRPSTRDRFVVGS